MAISPACDKCNQELTDYGALLFGPPGDDSTVHKFHLCKSCYADIAKDM